MSYTPDQVQNAIQAVIAGANPTCPLCPHPDNQVAVQRSLAMVFLAGRASHADDITVSQALCRGHAIIVGSCQEFLAANGKVVR